MQAQTAFCCTRLARTLWSPAENPQNCFDSPGSYLANHCTYRRCRGCSFEKSLRNPADFAVGSYVAVVDLAVVDVAAAAAADVPAAAGYDRRSSRIPFVLPCHTDRAHYFDGVDDDDDCSARWCDNKTLTVPVFDRAVLIHYCKNLPTTTPPFVILSHPMLACRFAVDAEAFTESMTHNRNNNDSNLLLQDLGMNFNFLSTMEIMITH